MIRREADDPAGAAGGFQFQQGILVAAGGRCVLHQGGEVVGEDEGALIVRVLVAGDALVARTVKLFKTAIGDKNVIPISPITASEDFSDFINQGIPSMFYTLGVYDPKKVAEASQPGGKPLPFNHSPFFAPVPEPTFKTGVETMTLAVMNVMQ